jgi:hypothetical protein
MGILSKLGKGALFGGAGWIAYENIPTEEQVQYLKDNYDLPDGVTSVIQTLPNSKEWLQKNVFNKDGLANLLENTADEAANAATEAAERMSQIGADSGFAGLASWIENFGGKLLHWIGTAMGSTNLQSMGLSIINSARSQQEGKPPQEYVDGKFVDIDTETPEPEITANSPGAPGTGSTPAIVPDMKVTNDFGTKMVNYGRGNGSHEVSATYSDRFKTAAGDINWETVTAEELLEIAASADIEFKDELSVLEGTTVMGSALQDSIASIQGEWLTVTEARITNLFSDFHEAAANSPNAPVMEQEFKQVLGL